MAPTRRSVLAGLASAPVPGGKKREANPETVPPDIAPFKEGFLFSHDDITHPVYRDGEGPGVLLLHEMPGTVPEFWRLATWIRDAGFSIFTPDLYTDKLNDITPPSLSGGMLRACISREIHLFAANVSSPITQWLRSLSRSIHAKTGEQGVGVIGLCMTGNFALSLVLEPSVVATVASEPSLPLTLTNAGHRALHLDETERQALRERTEVDVMALRFQGDPVCRKARFDALEDLVGTDRLIRIELPDSAQNPQGNSFPHAVLTRDLIDEEGSLTLEARDRVLAFLNERLKPDTPLPATQ